MHNEWQCGNPWQSTSSPFEPSLNRSWPCVTKVECDEKALVHWGRAVQQGATKPTCKSKSGLGGFGSFVAPLLEVKRAPAPRVHDVLRATHPPMFFWMLLWAGACSCWVSGGCGVGLGWCLGLPHYQMHARHLTCRLGCRNVPAPAYYFRFSFQLFGGGRGMRVRDIFGAPHVVQ